MKRIIVIIVLAVSFIGLEALAAKEWVDDLGERVEMEATPQRIVSLAPSNTELLFALGLGDRVVGVTDVCDFPAAVADIDQVAGYNSLNLEKIAAVTPDLVLAARGNDIEGIRSLRKLGLQVFSLDIQNLEQLLQAIERVGDLCGVQAQAVGLRGDLAARIAKVEKLLVGAKTRPRAMWGYWSEPVYTAGPGTMIDDVITKAGGNNVASQAEGAWPQVGMETILAWAPEVIITTYIPSGLDSLGAEIARLQKTDGWQKVPAVESGRIYYVEANWLLRPGPRLIDAFEAVAQKLHPQLFQGP